MKGSRQACRRSRGRGEVWRSRTSRSVNCFSTLSTMLCSWMRRRPTNTSCRCMRAWWKRSLKHNRYCAMTTKMIPLVSSHSVHYMHKSTSGHCLILGSCWLGSRWTVSYLVRCGKVWASNKWKYTTANCWTTKARIANACGTRSINSCVY